MGNCDSKFTCLRVLVSITVLLRLMVIWELFLSFAHFSIVCLFAIKLHAIKLPFICSLKIFFYLFRCTGS